MDVVIAIPGSKATVSIGGPLQAIILLLALWSVFTSRMLRLKSPVVWTFILLWLIMGISMMESPDLIKAVKEWGRIGSFVFIYILAGLSFREEKDIRQFVRVSLLSTIVPVIVAAYQLATHTGLFAGAMDPYHRLMGTFGNPNGLAQFLSFPLLICLTVALDKETSGPKRLLFGGLAFLFLITVSQTYSRSAWFGMLAGALVIGFKRNKALLLVIPILILFFLAFVPLKSIRLAELETGKLKMSGRIDNWQMMLPRVLERPVLGRGLTAMSDYTESDHVRLLLETGFLGWLSFLLLLWTLYRAGSKNLTFAGQGIERNFALAFLAFFACTVTVGFAGTNIIFQYWFWVPAGVAMSRSIRKPGKTNDNDAGLVGRRSQDETRTVPETIHMRGALSQ
jgi:O-antigen ligase